MTWGEGGVELFAVDAAVEGFRLAEAAKSETAEDAEVGDGVAGAGAARVLAEGDIEDPMALVLDGPVAAHGLGEENPPMASLCQ